MSKHTPGPWGVRFFKSKEHRVSAPTWDTLAIVHGNEDDAALDREGRANARLIAAAPDLLKALQDIRHHFVCGCDEAYTSRNRHAPECKAYELDDLDAAITKAVTP